MQPEDQNQQPEQQPAPVAEQNPPSPISQPKPAMMSSDELKKINNPLIAMQPGERVICQIQRHPVGLLGTYIMDGLVLMLSAIGAFVIVPKYAPDNLHAQAIGWALAAFIFIAIFTFIFSYIAIKVYKGNRWIVTSDSITQLSQISLFNRQSSQLSLHNLEDITVDQNGIIQSILNFGTLHAETAGERAKFVFPYCPNPNHCAREILTAREQFMGGGAFEGKANNNNLPPHDQGPSDPGINIGTNG
jgi:hypothetical protein